MQDDLRIFHAKHFPHASAPSQFVHGAENVEEPAEEYYEYDEEDDGLGYHPDGVKRTLTDEQIAKLPFALYRQGYEYYWKTHAHPGSTFKYTTSSLLDLMRFDATNQIELINQPLLMIAGSKADSLYMTQDAFPKATGTKDKELFIIDGATHIETYWVPKFVDAALGKLTPFYARTL